MNAPLKAGDELGGHIVSGHVDGVGTITLIEPEETLSDFNSRAQEELSHFIASKGSIAVNGVSLTVNEVSDAIFGVNIIPHTRENTTFGSFQVGALVNLEIDLLARYVARLLRRNSLLASSEYLSTIDDIIEDARNGRMFILVDDEERENEGDLVIPAQMATPDAINFMATNGRGLICLALTQNRINQLNLHPMSQTNTSRHETAFTTSIEAKEGVTTGISASDRARTIAVAIDATKGPEDIGSPGHVFPLASRDGGVLVRAGHTEASVDLARLSGLTPAGVICEIMNDDGTMARMPDLVDFAQKHGLKIATIADLIAYRLKHDRIVKADVETELETIGGGIFRNDCLPKHR